jgi:hypothetical protein
MGKATAVVIASGSIFSDECKEGYSPAGYGCSFISGRRK